MNCSFCTAELHWISGQRGMAPYWGGPTGGSNCPTLGPVSLHEPDMERGAVEEWLDDDLV